jgi:hypothetical protein
MLATHIDEMLEANQEQYATLLKAKDTPYVLDNNTIQQVITAFTVAQQTLTVFDEQLKYWASEMAMAEQRQHIIHVQEKMQTLHRVVNQVLQLADELAKSTIEKLLAKSDEELGREYRAKMLGREQKLSVQNQQNKHLYYPTYS